jgi:glutamate carboxypeptidase
MNELNAYLHQQMPAMVSLLRELVEIESQSDEKAGVDHVGVLIAQQLQRLGATVQMFPQVQTGDHVLGTFNAGGGSPIVMILHMDTVWPTGTLAKRPVRIEGDRFYGPGAYDMKASSVIALFALQALRVLGLWPQHEIRVFFTSDEETGSHTSRALIENIAQGAALCMVMEPALADGKLKSSRKGVGDFRVTAYGRAAHAGAEHRNGINAIEELAHQVLRIQALTDYARGVTFNVGDIHGGGVTNVVPDWATLQVDTRVAVLADAQWVMDALYGLRPVLPGTRLEISGEMNRPPMECNAQRLAIFRRVQDIGRTVGLDLDHGPSGGGSDASFTAGLGIPTLDGFGAVGDGAHAVHEHVLLPSLPERAALCAAILRDFQID